MAESEPPKPKPLPVIRLGLILMSHSQFLSVVCCTAGILALLLLPILAKNTYISENALMPGSANSMLSKDDVSEGGRFVNKILELGSGTSHPGIEVQRLIAHHLSALGIEVSYHKFQTEIHSFHPLRFFGSSDPQAIQYNLSCSSYGVNTVGIIRAPRGDGKEAIVLVTPYNSAKITEGEALSLGIVYSLFSLLSRVTWLAKDIVWLVADTQHGEYAAVAAWLGDYHSCACSNVQNLHFEMCSENSSTDLRTSSPLDMEIPDMFRRAGTLAAGLVIKVVETRAKYEKDSLKIYPEASNGQMPNLDLINIVNYLAVHRQGLQVKIEKVQSLVNSMWLKSLGNLFELLGYMARSVNPQWGFALPTSEYVEGFSTLISSLYNQALGVPTGPHGAFRDYQVDAITMEISSQLSVRSEFRQNELLWQGGRLIENTIRSVNNLLEKFHQSFFLYLMTSANKFVSVGVYMIAFALLVAPLPLVAASHFSRASQPTSKDESTPKPNSLDDLTVMYNRSWKWLNAAKMVFLVHLWGALMIFFPYFYSHLPESSPLSTLLPYTIFFLISITIVGSFRSQKTEWAYLKSVTISSAFTGLSLMSIINFATAEIGALLLVPICLMTSPLRSRTRTRTTTTTSSFRTVFEVMSNLGLLLLAFPPVTFFVVKVMLMKEGIEGVRIGNELWYWVEALWEWSSATYVYVCLVHLPCWVLCILILFHPC